VESLKKGAPAPAAVWWFPSHPLLLSPTPALVCPLLQHVAAQELGLTGEELEQRLIDLDALLPGEAEGVCTRVHQWGWRLQCCSSGVHQ
jgi:hypothetical protein